MTPKPAAERVFDDIARDVKRLATAVGGGKTVLGAALDHLYLDRRGPNGHAYDGIPGQRTESWCWVHEQPTATCHREDMPCDGETVIVADPTGEAALTPDRAAQLRVDIASDLVAIRIILSRLMPKVENATTATGDVDLRRLGNSNAAPGCDSCARIAGPRGGKYWNPPHGAPTDWAGVLPRKMRLCKTCRRDLENPDLNRLPTIKELETRRDGKRVHRKAS